MRKFNEVCLYFHTETELEFCPKCKLKIHKGYKEKLQERIDAIPLEMKQKLLDGVWKGFSVGESAKLAGFNEDDVSLYGQILYDQIESFNYLRKEVKI